MTLKYGELPMGPGGEFDVVRRIIHRWGKLAHGIGDDAAILPAIRSSRYIMSTDTSVENIHFKREWLTPMEIGYRAAMAALSDIAAMGGMPHGMLVALTVPESWRSDLDGITGGIGAAVDRCNTVIIGGDITKGSELSINCTVIGRTRSPMRRNRARVGDHIYLTGKLGATQYALRFFKKGKKPPELFYERFATPTARIAEGMWLNAHGARAAVDVSDGLVSDLKHIVAASGVIAEIHLERIPAYIGVSPIEAASSGEEYELVVTSTIPLHTGDFEKKYGIPLTDIGLVLAKAPKVDGEPRPELITYMYGERVDVPPGHDHFPAIKKRWQR